MLCDQYPLLVSGDTKVARLKGVRHGQASFVSEVFGEGNRARRLLPLSVEFPPSLRPHILGFRALPPRATGKRPATSAAFAGRWRQYRG